jgi:hypothetical protein
MSRAVPSKSAAAQGIAAPRRRIDYTPRAIFDAYHARTQRFAIGVPHREIAQQNGLKGGRPKGSKNTPHTVTEAILARYREQGVKLADEMLRLALHAKFEPTRVSAINKIQDRVMGKPPQPVTGGDGKGPVEFVWRFGQRELRIPIKARASTWACRLRR